MEKKTIAVAEFSAETLALYDAALGAAGSQTKACNELAVNLKTRSATYTDAIRVLGLLAKERAQADQKDATAVRLYTRGALMLLCTGTKPADLPTRPTDRKVAEDKLTVNAKEKAGITSRKKAKAKAKVKPVKIAVATVAAKVRELFGTPAGRAQLMTWAKAEGHPIMFTMTEKKGEVTMQGPTLSSKAPRQSASHGLD